MTSEWSHKHLQQAVDAACVALWSWNVDTNIFRMDAKAFDLWGLEHAPSIEFETLSANIHPADRDRVREAFEATRSVEGPYEIDFRILVGEDIRWISARGRGADEGIRDRTMFGVFLNVTGRKQAEEGHELLAGEMSHRVKNLLAIATSLTAFTSRSTETIEHMAQELTQRLTALGRAHDLVRPLPGSQGHAAILGDLLTVLLAPYDDLGAFSGRIRVAVPRMGVGERTATALAMIFHELSTNSAKHGALSSETGALEVTGSTDEETLTLVWAETGGPAIVEPPALKGFGSRMVQSNLGGQLRGSIDYDWKATGLVAKLKLRISALQS
ncbi:PAS domain-containing protein [Altererythrobacter sp. KTW20L]|uniref:sensor histidine kinase n=1 Tax=Altererythrobacter sp. KTW20L TaxID=2942210 RepID=UPI0020BF30E6|nr:sensor histidine kinase [Altererythrobacter sp. KTW20L]MCL6250834.1 PAS domain-containing protein [Altererythrobacter sp. KTW20L]